MGELYILEGLKVKIEMDSVLESIDCKKDNPMYEEIAEEYEAIWQETLAMAEPVGIFGFGELPDFQEEAKYPAGTRVIYAVTSIGDQIKQCSTRLFQEGDYVRGMLCDAIADAALFSLEDQLQEKLKEICGAHHIGIVRRLEAPQDIPMAVQRAAWECLKLKENLGIEISCGYMFDPVKTSCQVFVLTEDTAVFRAQHDCRNCSNVNCRYRNIPKTEIRVEKGSETKILQLGEGESLMDALLREGYYISAVCGGKGRCGKCRVRVVKGAAKVTDEDRSLFSEDELEKGWRLSCMLYPQEDLTIRFALNDESEFEAVSGFSDADQVNGSGNSESQKKYADSSTQETKILTKNKRYEIAIDIGTTTIAFALLEKGSGQIIHTVTSVNSQRKYGADVIARIQASVDGKKRELRSCIQKDLQQGMQALTETQGISLDQVVRIAISGNTTMGHLLMGYDCSSLGVYPFAPVNIGFIHGSMKNIIGIPGSAAVVLLPGISTYVGADIASGLYACEFGETDEICLLVDLGTNGEMALGNREKILVTSTAAGPAFEGGNITWGMGSVAGAICSVKLEGDKAHVKTIREKTPVGICGTGVIETVAELLRAELLDETGLLDEAYFDDGFPLAQTQEGEQIVFTQKDIREIQLAKAAIRAGVKTLLLRYGIGREQVAKVYLAGGFGYRLDTQKAVVIGMLPEELADRIQAVGNSSLAGAMKYLREEAATEKLSGLVGISDEIGLSSDKDFNEFYMESMMFDME